MPIDGLPRFLINEDGQSFSTEIGTLQRALEFLSNPERASYRDNNAAAIAIQPVAKLLIIAGPGTGKSFLFRARIKYWLKNDRDSRVYVSSFVRKLVNDLEVEIANDPELDDDARKRVNVSTLHSLARSLIERNHGTETHHLRPHIEIIAGDWEEVVWDDVLCFFPTLRRSEYLHEDLTRQFYTEELIDTPDWEAVRGAYRNLGQFFNAVGFSDMIVLAREAVQEQPRLGTHLLWIIDEYQDFNMAEDHLIRSLTNMVEGVLITGDDDQVLYQELKSSLPDIITSYYNDGEFSNGMLPFCGRCSYYICLVASDFIRRNRSAAAIEKVFLPVKVDLGATKVQIVATFQPTSAVDYIEKFLADHRADLNVHIEKMKNSQVREVDPFLLILTPEKTAKFYRDNHADERLRNVVSAFSIVSTVRSRDYRKVATYCQICWNPSNNFAVRKGLHHEGISTTRVHDLIYQAISEHLALAELTDELELASLLDKALKVSNIILDESLDSSAKSAALASLLSLSDEAGLASELAMKPLGATDNLSDDASQEAIESSSDVAAVEMMTMFKSKGLSAQHVIIIGCDDVNLRRTAALTFFVGITRARKSLHLITSMKAGGSTRAADYVLDLPPDACEYVEYRKTGRRVTILQDRQTFIKLLERWSSASHRR